MSDNPLTANRLFEKLKEVDDWYALGVALDMRVVKLREIQASSNSQGDCKIDMFQSWLDSTPTASWEDVIRALEQIDHHTLADRLRSRYTQKHPSLDPSKGADGPGQQENKAEGIDLPDMGAPSIKMTGCAQKIVNDPVHGPVVLAPLLVGIIDTEQFQRLRDIKQLGPVYYVYPGASHNRFEHSIGVCHLAKQMLKNLKCQEEGKLFSRLGVTEKDEMCVLIAALCHELGQGPMSHLYQDLFIPETKEGMVEEWTYVQASIKMLDHLMKQNADKLREQLEVFGIDPAPKSSDMMFIKELIYGGPLPGQPELKGRTSPNKWFLYEIVSNAESGIDVDKMDYIARDCHGLGIHHNFDWQRFMNTSRVIMVARDKKRTHICPREKEARSLYELFQIRDRLFRHAYQHKTKRAIEHMLNEALLAANPHIKLIGREGREVKMSEAIDDMCAFTRLTDSIFWEIKSSARPELKKARDILEQVERRELFRSISSTLSKENTKENPTDLKTYIPHEREQIQEHLVKGCERDQNDIKPEDILVDFVTFNYGKGIKDPIEMVWFHRKHDPDRAMRIKREQVSNMLPSVFEEFEIRLYLKKWVSRELEEELFRLFNEWCKQNGYATPAGANGSSPSHK